MLELSQILQNLWIGSRPEESSDYTYISNLGIQLVVDLTTDMGYDFKDNESEWKSRLIRYINIPIVDMCPPDNASIETLKQVAFPMINSGFITYLHCRAGKGRSPTIAILYLMVEENMSFDEAASLVRNAHDATYLNWEQYDFLRRYNNG